jgi:hypothetical protein
LHNAELRRYWWYGAALASLPALAGSVWLIGKLLVTPAPDAAPLRTTSRPMAAETLSHPDLSNGRGVFTPPRLLPKPATASVPAPGIRQAATKLPSGSMPASIDNHETEQQLAQAETCLAEKHYDCALAKSQAVKHQNPASERARRLLDQAHAARQKALESIQIE